MPTTQGQVDLADYLAGFFESHGAVVERDGFGNVVARLAGRGALADAPPLALMVHLDTAPGTLAVPSLTCAEAWDGSALSYSGNPGLRVDTEVYPSLAAFVGQDVLHGPGVAPFGLDDKLGLAHLMTLARLLAAEPELPHLPLLLVGRPDEEVGRDAALIGLAARLAELGVTRGYTVDGIDPFEINLENFEAAGGSLTFAAESAPDRPLHRLHLRGVNTHGATAAAEGHRPAPRLASELRRAVQDTGIEFWDFRSDPARDCDAELRVFLPTGTEAELRAALEQVFAEHRVRGASWTLEPAPPGPVVGRRPTEAMLRFVSGFLDSGAGVPLAAEDSAERQGYTQPYRAEVDEQGLRLDLRIRDFEPSGLRERQAHVRRCAETMAPAAIVRFADQYTNMGPRLAPAPELRTWARDAAVACGLDAPLRPIRGGTGIDPMLDAGVLLGNLGTGYFAPESEKELTSRQQLAQHALWLVALAQLAHAG